MYDLLIEKYNLGEKISNRRATAALETLFSCMSACN